MKQLIGFKNKAGYGFRFLFDRDVLNRWNHM